jgi:hypothetical protein
MSPARYPLRHAAELLEEFFEIDRFVQNICRMRFRPCKYENTKEDQNIGVALVE